MQVAGGLKDTSARLAGGLVDTGKEKVDTGVRWMQWGVTKVLTKGGRRKGWGRKDRGWEDPREEAAAGKGGKAGAGSSVASKVDQQRMEGGSSDSWMSACLYSWQWRLAGASKGGSKDLALHLCKIEDAQSALGVPIICIAHHVLDETVCPAHPGELCPRVMYLGVSNTMAQEGDAICRVALFAPFWVDNRTGFDLVFRDLDVPSAFDSLPFLRELRLAGVCFGCIHL